MSNRMRGVNPRTNLKAVVNTRRGLKGATTLPKAYLAAGVATMLGVVGYATVYLPFYSEAGIKRREEVRQQKTATRDAFDNC